MYVKSSHITVIPLTLFLCKFPPAAPCFLRFPHNRQGKWQIRTSTNYHTHWAAHSSTEATLTISDSMTQLSDKRNLKLEGVSLEVGMRFLQWPFWRLLVRWLTHHFLLWALWHITRLVHENNKGWFIIALRRTALFAYFTYISSTIQLRFLFSKKRTTVTWLYTLLWCFTPPVQLSQFSLIHTQDRIK